MSLKKARDVIRSEIKALQGLARRLDKRFLQAVERLAQCEGRVVVTGMGKTGIIGRKIVATLSSTGTPSIWMHSAEAVHGDLGQVRPEDVVIVISNSGETEETTRLVPYLKKRGAPVIAMTGNLRSTLAKHSDIVLDVGVEKEGCPLGLAPMASTTATLVMGDALAACLIVKKGFRKEDFAVFHPGGALGKRLLLTVKDIMRRGREYPRVKETTKVKDVLLATTRARCGSACIVDRNGKLVGIFTDGDLRRHLDRDERLLDRAVGEVMTSRPTTIQPERLAVEAFQILKSKRIDEIPVVDKGGRSVGLLDIQDLLKAGLM